MLSILYLLICMTSGYVICSLCLPELFSFTDKTYRQNSLGLSRMFVLLPASFGIGTLIVSWTTYVLGYVFRKNSHPLVKANQVTLAVFAILIAAGIVYIVKSKKAMRPKNSFRDIKKSEVVFMVLAAVLSYILMWGTFYVSHNHINVGVSVYDELTSHLGMIRSFSYGSNFPTYMSHMAGKTTGFHFMFDFLVGNLEYLGLRIDYALNIASFLSFFSCTLLLYSFATKLSGKRSVGYITCVLFVFRSSESLFTLLSSASSDSHTSELLSARNGFVGYTPSETDGIFGLNSFCSDRGFAFTVIFFILTVMLFMPFLYDAEKRLLAFSREFEGRKSKKAIALIKTAFSFPEGVKPKNIRMSVSLGIFLGLTFYFCGASFAAAVAIIGFIFVLADHRMDIILCVFSALAMFVLQVYMLSGGEIGSLDIYVGFLSENRTFFGIANYIKELLGILPIVVLVVFTVSKKLRRYHIICFLAPFIAAFVFRFPGRIHDGSKLVILSVMLLNIFVAHFIVSISNNRGFFVKLLAAAILLILISTGVYDLVMIAEYNNPGTNYSFNLDNSLTVWVKDNARSSDTFLTADYSLGGIVLGGGMLYLGDSEGLALRGTDVTQRAAKREEIISSESAEQLKKLLLEEGIDYIVIDNQLRKEYDCELFETIVKESFVPAFESGDGQNRTVVYKVKGV